MGSHGGRRRRVVDDVDDAVAERAVAARAREARGADVVCPRHADSRGREADGLYRADATKFETIRAPDHVEGRVGPALFIFPEASR
jgi:hypothetical protein